MDKYTFKDLKGKERTIKVGDRVIFLNGDTGTVRGFCACSECEKRGFYEIKIDYEHSGINRVGYITVYDYLRKFDDIYKIGEEEFNPPPTQKEIDALILRHRQDILRHKSEIIRLEAEINDLQQFKQEVCK